MNTRVMLAMFAALLCPKALTQAQEVFLVIDRASGSMDVVANGDLEVDGYEIQSPDGLFLMEGWSSLSAQGVGGWEEASPTESAISELNWTGASMLGAGTPLSLGSPYDGVGIYPEEEDVSFRYSMPGNVVGEGTVYFTGPSALPTINVDLGTGGVSLSNPGDFPITGYSISSPDGTLNTDMFNGLTDQGIAEWTEANPLGSLVSELSLTSELAFGGTSYDLGDIYTGGDISLSYSTPDGSVSEGIVDFGATPDLVLQVDLFSGETKIQNMSSAAGPFDVIGYAVTSPSGSLVLDGWDSLSDQGDTDWVESNPREDSIAELNPSGSLLFENGTSVSLGSIFGGTQDLEFQYGTLDGSAMGTVEYVLSLGGDGAPTCADVAASRTIAGDLDGVDGVAFADFLVMSANFGATTDSYEDGDIDCNGTVAFADFLVLSANFGQTGAATSVPEPMTNLMALMATFMLLPLRNRRRSK